MSDSRRVPEATELVYVAPPTWIPLFVAAGLTAIFVGLFTGIVWAIVGAVVFLLAVLRWSHMVSDETSRLPRKQRLTTAVLPPISPRQR